MIGVNEIVIDEEDASATIASFYNALLGYYDDFVCMDRPAVLKVLQVLLVFCST